jgi:2-oxoisovalerate dehydrogenase E1 component
VTEEYDLTSFGRHVHSWITQNCFYDLDCTPAFISALQAPPAPYNAPEETAFYPTAQTIEKRIEEVLAE